MTHVTLQAAPGTACGRILACTQIGPVHIANPVAVCDESTFDLHAMQPAQRKVCALLLSA
jgi:hypothetical protein